MFQSNMVQPWPFYGLLDALDKMPDEHDGSESYALANDNRSILFRRNC